MSREDLSARCCESRRLVEWGSVSSILSISEGGLLRSLFGGLLLRCVYYYWVDGLQVLSYIVVRQASFSLFVYRIFIIVEDCLFH